MLESAALARKAERRRLAGEAPPQVGAEKDAATPRVAWTGCQWLMEGYCGRVPGDRDDAAPQDVMAPHQEQQKNAPPTPLDPNRAA